MEAENDSISKIVIRPRKWMRIFASSAPLKNTFCLAQVEFGDDSDIS